MFKEFKDFAMKGNFVDMAVGIVIGAAFSTIVKSLVDDIIMPVVGVLTGGVDFSNIFFPLKAASEGAEYATLAAAQAAANLENQKLCDEMKQISDELQKE